MDQRLAEARKVLLRASRLRAGGMHPPPPPSHTPLYRCRTITNYQQLTAKAGEFCLRLQYCSTSCGKRRWRGSSLLSFALLIMGPLG